MMEEKLALAHILRKFDIVKENTVRDEYGINDPIIDFQTADLILQGSLTLTPVEVPVKIVARKWLSISC